MSDFMAEHVVRLDTEYEAILNKRDAVFRELTAIRTAHHFMVYEQKYNKLPSAPRCVHHRQMERFFLKKHPLLERGSEVMLDMLEPFSERMQDEFDELLGAKSVMRTSSSMLMEFAPKRFWRGIADGGEGVVRYYNELKRFFETPLSSIIIDKRKSSHLERTAREVLALRSELAAIRAENGELRSRVVTLEAATSARASWVTAHGSPAVQNRKRAASSTHDLKC
jgi:hypothetical protein